MRGKEGGVSVMHSATLTETTDAQKQKNTLPVHDSNITWGGVLGGR